MDMKLMRLKAPRATERLEKALNQSVRYFDMSTDTPTVLSKIEQFYNSPANF